MNGSMLFLVILTGVLGRKNIIPLKQTAKEYFPTLLFKDMRTWGQTAKFQFKGEPIAMPQDCYLTLWIVGTQGQEMEYLDIRFKDIQHSQLQLYQQVASGSISQYQRPQDYFETDEKLILRRYFDFDLEAGTKILLYIPPNQLYQLVSVTRTIGTSTQDAHHIRALLAAKIVPKIGIASYKIYPTALPPTLLPQIDKSYLAYVDTPFANMLPFEIQVRVEEFYRNLRYGITVPHSPKLSLSESLEYFPKVKMRNSEHRSTVLYSFTQENLSQARFLPTDRFLTLYETTGDLNRKTDLVIMTFQVSGACSAVDEYVEVDEKIVKLLDISHIRPSKLAPNVIGIKYDTSSFEENYPPQSKILLYIPMTCKIQLKSLQRYFMAVTVYQMYQAYQDRRQEISIAQDPDWRMMLTGHVPLLWQLYFAIKTKSCFE